MISNLIRIKFLKEKMFKTKNLHLIDNNTSHKNNLLIMVIPTNIHKYILTTLIMFVVVMNLLVSICD